MTTTFYVPPTLFQGDQVELPDEEARHAVRVLRMREGDELVVVDGAGGWHRVEVIEAGKRRVRGRVLETRREVGEPAYELTLGVALLKNRNRFETMLEKAVECGVRRIVPLQTARTEKGSLKAERSENILIAALKQSGRSRLPELAVPMGFDDIVRENADLALIAHEQVGNEQTLLDVLSRHPDACRLHVLIGPEGGFTDDEVARAQAAGYLPVSLGPRRLRAETAALTAATGIMLWMESESVMRKA